MAGKSGTFPKLSPNDLAALERAKRVTLKYLAEEPGFGEALIPVWGSAREAAADYIAGDYAGAAMNAGLAVSDIIPGATIVKGAAKAGVKAALKPGMSRTWNATRKRMARAGHFEPGQQGHHWAIPQGPVNVPFIGDVGRFIPDSVRNHPANIKVLPADVHKRIHSRDLKKGLPRYNYGERLLHGTPTWAKANAAQGMTVVGRGIERQLDDDR